LAILTERGYRALTMAGVAERAGVSTATLYRRWASKQDLVVGTVATLVPDRDPADTGSLAGDLTATLMRSVERLNGEVGRLMKGIIGETVRNPELAEALRHTVLDPRLEELTDVLDRAADRGEIPPVSDHRLAMNVILGPLNYRFLITEEPLSADVVDRLVPLLLRALGCLPCGDAD
jgi:AcrR family transcriptional regulator